ncbi:hypothetical protein PR048_012976 [Dryococelus australis]|uniref:Uncharacterized protein n=1 Tax=Dryococelus australis TaxID=614101 RepID=A0ABQ9HRP5_9NEOP|nr:hypothetical protein PR048_012976 [Dryococelus australis]
MMELQNMKEQGGITEHEQESLRNNIATKNKIVTINKLTNKMGIVPDDAVGGRVFSGISHFPRPFIPAPLYFTSITLISSQDIAVKSRPNLFTHLPEMPCLYKNDELEHRHLNNVARRLILHLGYGGRKTYARSISTRWCLGVLNFGKRRRMSAALGSCVLNKLHDTKANGGGAKCGQRLYIGHHVNTGSPATAVKPVCGRLPTPTGREGNNKKCLTPPPSQIHSQPRPWKKPDVLDFTYPSEPCPALDII